MAVRVGVNGFGRIGRMVVRAAWGKQLNLAPMQEFPSGAWGDGNIEIAHINEREGGVTAAAHLLKYDSVHGTWPIKIEARQKKLCVGNKQLSFSDYHDPKAVDWEAYGVELVLECTGNFRSMKSLRGYFERGVKKVIVAAPINEPEVLNVVVGVNDNLYDKNQHNIITAASCTTNCLAPIIKVIHENIGILHGTITTIHDATNTQTIIDEPSKDLRRARSSLLNLIPTTTGSATAIGLIYPDLAGKLNGLAVRVPILNASLTDCVFEVSCVTTVDEVNAMIKEASIGTLSGILGYEERPLVSSDFCNDQRSSIVDGLSTMVVGGTQLKILAWYDNEYGYACRMSELANKVASEMKKIDN